MRKTHSALLFIGVCLLITQCNSTNEIQGNFFSSKTPFGVCYSKVTPAQVQNYKMVVIEPDFYSKAEINDLKATGATIVAYTTFGEVDSNRWYFPLLEERGFLGLNMNWNSSFLNLKDDSTRSLILNKVLPEIMTKGVDGIFMDTIDAVSPYTERAYLAPYMLSLIKEVRDRYPDKLIIQNAGLFLLEDSQNLVDAVLIEDIASGYDFDKKQYYIKNLNSYKGRIELIKTNLEKYNIPFLIVDFAEELSSIKEVRSRLDTLNVPYFISNIELSKLPVESSKVANKITVN